jgi:transcriptional regulator with XRE-family HTH domain
MDKSINQRFAKILEEKNISQADYADRIKTGRANVNNWCRLKNAIPLDSIVELLNMFPDIDARWLLTGSPRAYNTDQLPIVIDDPIKVNYADKDYIINMQKKVIEIKEKEIETLGEIAQLKEDIQKLKEELGKK